MKEKENFRMASDDKRALLGTISEQMQITRQLEAGLKELAGKISAGVGEPLFDDVSKSGHAQQGAAVEYRVPSRAPSSSLVSGSEDEDGEFQKLLQYGQLILLKTDMQFRVTEVLGSSEKLFGYTKAELIGRSDMWERFFDPLDLRRLSLRLKRMGSRVHEFGEELRFTRRGETTPRWLLLKATPVMSRDGGSCVGWEGFGIDITERRLVELQLRAQRQRVEALYEVSRALRVNLDPALVSLKGLNALIRATGSDAGLCCFYDEYRGELEMVAAEGLSGRYVDGILKIVDGPNLIRYTVEQKRGMLLDNIQEDVRAARELARLEDLKSTILMPLMSSGKVLGCIALFSRTAGRFSREDLQLVAAAASQITFAARQAEFYISEKAEADALAVLYRLSHEMSRLFQGSEIGEHLFSVLQQEFSSRRLWFGIMNHQGTHIAGQAGFGPDIRKEIKEVQIELGLRHDFLDEAVRTKRPVIVPAGTQMECSGLNRFFEKIQVGTLVIVPLVSLNQVVGVFVAEPVIGSVEYIQKKLSLLTRMANEVAMVLMARRFEERVAESDKMRVAAMLGAGVAHNFNNLLQAVMGQASLIQMQTPPDSPVQELAKTIIDSAGKGASLVRHLLSFSSPTTAARESFSLNRLLQDSKDLYDSLLGGSIEVRVQVEAGELPVVGDAGLIQQAISNILVNAKEAIGERSGGRVEISVRQVRLSSGEIDPALLPGVYSRIDIRDNGPGMDEERMARCFEPFYSSKDLDQTTGLSLSGAGLGLSSAYSLARQHGGILTVSSIRGEGATFSLFLPLHERSEPSKLGETEQSLAGAPVALLLQPYGSSGMALQRVLEDFGIRSKLLHDMQAAEVELGISEMSNPSIPSRVSRESGSYDLLLVDGDYLAEDTVPFLVRLQAAWPHLSVILLSVSRDYWSEQSKGLFPEGRLLVVEKPVSVRTIQGALRDFNQGQSEARSMHVRRETGRMAGEGARASTLKLQLEKVEVPPSPRSKPSDSARYTSPSLSKRAAPSLSKRAAPSLSKRAAPTESSHFSENLGVSRGRS